MASLVDADAPRQSTAPSTGLRWEWRSFGQRFGAAEERIAQYAPSDPKETDEIYFLSGGGDNVKVRDELMDVKILREVNADGLEQWAPVMKAPFPMSAADAAKVFDALRFPLPAALREGCELDEFIEAFAGAGQRRPRGPRPQEARALHGRRLHGRAFRYHG